MKKNKDKILNIIFMKQHPETLQEAVEIIKDELNIKVSVSYLSKWFKENGYVKVGAFGSIYDKMYLKKENNR